MNDDDDDDDDHHLGWSCQARFWFERALLDGWVTPQWSGQSPCDPLNGRVNPHVTCSWSTGAAMMMPPETSWSAGATWSAPDQAVMYPIMH